MARLLHIHLRRDAVRSTRERRVTSEYRATVPAATSGKDFRLWIPVPHDDEYQRITDLKIVSSAPYKVATDPLGNALSASNPAPWRH